MDRQSADFEIEKTTFSSVPLRCFTPMPAQPIVPWTFPRMVFALGNWLMEETPVILEAERTEVRP